MDSSILSLIHKECDFTTSKSSGPGGQHVNKTETKVTLKWNIEQSQWLSDRNKQRLQKVYENQINHEGDWVLHSQESRSQLKNKERVLKKLNALIAKGLKEKKRRKRTKPSKAAQEERIQSKKRQSDKKAMRKKPKY